MIQETPYVYQQMIPSSSDGMSSFYLKAKKKGKNAFSFYG